MMDELKTARVYSYIRVPYLMVYIILLIGLFIWYLISSFHLLLTQRANSNWIRFDIPWFGMVIMAWVSTIQRISYRRKLVTLRLDKLKSVCIIEGDSFSGEWRLHKKSPRFLGSMKPLTVIGMGLIVFILIMSLMELSHVRNVMIKVDAVQSLCQAVLLMGVFLPFLSFWRYPYVIDLRKGDKLLRLQYKA